MQIARQFDGEFAVYVKDLSTNERYTLNAATPFYLASVVKLPIVITAYRQVDRGQLTLDEELVFSEHDVRDGAPRLKEAAVGDKFSVREVIQHMMVSSDNSATDMLLRRIGVDHVNQMLVESGVPGFREITPILEVRRRVASTVDPRAAELTPGQVFEIWRPKPLRHKGQLLGDKLGQEEGWTFKEMSRAFSTFYATQVNSATMEGVGLLLEGLVEARLVTPSSTAEILSIMKACETGSRRLRAGLPPDVEIAHKTGTQHRRACDVGVFLLSPSRPIVLAVCAKEFWDLVSAERIIAKIARKAHQALIAAPPVQPAPTALPQATEAVAAQPVATGSSSAPTPDPGSN